LIITPLASSSRGNAYLIRDGAAPPLLLEAGLPFQDLRKRIWEKGITTGDLGGCLISHEHGDHAKAATELARMGTEIYCSIGTAQGAMKKGLQDYRHRIVPVQARRQFSIGPWTVVPFETVHDAAEPLGFLIAKEDQRLVYATDTAYVPVRFRGLTSIMIECNYCPELLAANTRAHPETKIRVIKNHLALDQTKRFLRATDTRAVREIWLLHLSDNHSDAAKFKREIQALTGKPVYVADQ